MGAAKGTVDRPTAAGLIRRDFHGAVLLKYYIPLPDGGNAQAFVGKVSVFSDEEALGFKVSGGESNWCVRVAGASAALTFPGCQVRAVIALPDGAGAKNTDYWPVP